MFRDCLRCGTGWHDPLGVATLCICTGMTDEQAEFVKSLHEHITELRRVGRKASIDGVENLDTEERTLLGWYT